MVPPNKTDNTLPPLMECDPPVSNTASTPTSNRASVHTSVLRTTIQSSTPEPPERRRRTHSQVDPDSPVGFPFTEQRMKELLSEALAPLHKQLEEIQETQVRTIEEANYFHESLATLKSENKTLQDKLQVVEEENRNMRTRLITMESQSRRINLRFYGIPETKGENAEQLVHDFLSHKGFSYSPRAVERAHRLGPKTDKMRPIIVRFNHFKDREIIWRELGHGPIRVVKLLLCAYYYYYYYYFIYLNSLLLLLLLLRHIFKQPITITITITRKIKTAYYYYYYFPDYYYYYYFSNYYNYFLDYYYYFPILLHYC